MTLGKKCFAAAVLVLAAGTGCSKCVEDQAKPPPENQAPSLGDYSKRVGKQTAPTKLTDDAGTGPKTTADAEP